MKELTLVRLRENEWGTQGVLLDEVKPLCTTLERPWLNNQTNVSCIPAGEYYPVRGVFPKHGETFEIPVSGRVAILIHKGNLVTDSNGCILVGTGYGWINRQLAVIDSGTAFSDLFKYLSGINEFKLIIKAA